MMQMLYIYIIIHYITYLYTHIKMYVWSINIHSIYHIKKKKHNKMFSTIEFSPNQQNGLHLLLAHNASYTLSLN